MLSETSQGILLRIKVTPKSSTNKIYGVENGMLKIRVTSPPDKNLANEAVINVVSKAFDLSKSSIEIIKGHQSRQKTLCFLNQSLNFIEKQLEKILNQMQQHRKH